MVSLRKTKRLKPDRDPGICQGMPPSDDELMGSDKSCGSIEEQLEGGNRKGQPEEHSEMGGEKAEELEREEEGICEGVPPSDSEVRGSNTNCGSAEEQVEGGSGRGQQVEHGEVGGQKAGELEGKEERICEGMPRSDGEVMGSNRNCVSAEEQVVKGNANAQQAEHVEMGGERAGAMEEKEEGICEGMPPSDGEDMGSNRNCGSAEEQVEGGNGKGRQGEHGVMGGEIAGELEGKEEKTWEGMLPIEVMASNRNCGSAEEQVEGGNGKGQQAERGVMGGEKAGELDRKEDGIEGKDKKSGDLEGEDGVALKKPRKRGRKKKQVTVSLERGKKEIVEEGNVEGSSCFVAEKEGESEKKLEENGVQSQSFFENPEIANGDDGASMKEDADSGAADNRQGNSGDVLKRRLRAVARKVSYADVEDDEDKEFTATKRGQKGRRKRKVLESKDQEDGNNENNNRIPAKKRGRGRPKRKVFENEDEEGRDLKEEGDAEEQGSDLGANDGKERSRRGAKREGKMDKEVLGNGESLKKQDDESLGINTNSMYLLRRVPKKEEPVPHSKKKKDAKVNLSSFIVTLLL